MSWPWIILLNTVMVVGVVALFFVRQTSPGDGRRNRWFTVILFIVTAAAAAQLMDIAGFFS